MEFTIVDKPKDTERKGKWKRLFEPLAEGKAVRIVFEDKAKAQTQGRSIVNTLKGYGEIHFMVHTHIISEDGKWVLYCWKEDKKN